MRQFYLCTAISLVAMFASGNMAEAQNGSVDDKVVEWRRHIHQNPELSFKENQTADYVENILKGFGNIETMRPTPTSVVGILKGKKPGKTVAFRGDMDALPGTRGNRLALCFASIRSEPCLRARCTHGYVAGYGGHSVEDAG